MSAAALWQNVGQTLADFVGDDLAYIQNNYQFVGNGTFADYIRAEHNVPLSLYKICLMRIAPQIVRLSKRFKMVADDALLESVLMFVFDTWYMDIQQAYGLIDCHGRSGYYDSKDFEFGEVELF